MQLLRIIRATVFLSLFFLILPVGNAQPRLKPLSQYRIERWNPANGAPFNSINAITQSHDGYLWIGGNEGLFRFDGIRFVRFGRSHYPALLSTRVTALFEDSRGRLWIGTQGGGVSTLFRGQLTTLTSKQGLPSDYVKAIAEDLQGRIWVGTDGEGICEILPDTIATFNHKNSILDGRVTSLLTRRDSSVWVGTYGGLFKLEDGRWTRFGRDDGLSSDSILCLHETAGEVWIGTYGQGITILRNGAFVKFGRAQGLSGVNVTGIVGDTAGGIWVTTLRGGVDCIVGGKVSSYAIEGVDRGAYPVALARTRDGSVWAGLQVDGLLRLSDVPFTWFATGTQSKPAPVASVLEDHAGTMWFGTATGLKRLAEGSTEATPVSQSVLSIAECPNGTIWAGTLGKGIFKYENGIATSVDINRIPAFWALYSDRRGILWAGTNKGLVRIEGGERRVYTHNGNGLSHDDVRAICETTDSTLWVGTSYGLDKLAGDRFVSYTKNNSALSNDVIVALHPDANGDLWIGTIGGLNRFRNGTFTSITAKNGLPDDAAGMILEDNEGYFWISSDKGLYRVRKADLNDVADGKDSVVHCMTFGKEDGLLNNSTSGTVQPAAWKSHDGRVWFATPDGVAMVNPKDLTSNVKSPPLVIEGMTIDRKPIDIFAPVTMSYNVNEFEIDYTAPDFLKPQRLSFKYRLEGLDGDWIEAGTRRTAYFTHVPPGDYMFRVIAANENGIWNTAGATLSVAILPPFWMTWWFRGVVILLFLSSGPIVYFRRVRQLKRAQLAQQEVATRLIMSQEAERKRIAAELHDGLGQSLIIIKNRALLGKQSGEDRGMMSEQLDEIASTASAVLDDVRRIAHNLRPVHLERFGLTESIKAMIEGISSTSSISFRSTIDDAGGALSKEDEIHFFRVVQESISNVLKHSGATVADIKVTKADSGILFSLHDNGKGFSEQEVKAGLGLSDIRERVKILNGTFAIESNPGKGTTIKVTVPHSHGASVGA